MTPRSCGMGLPSFSQVMVMGKSPLLMTQVNMILSPCLRCWKLKGSITGGSVWTINTPAVRCSSSVTRVSAQVENGLMVNKHDKQHYLVQLHAQVMSSVLKTLTDSMHRIYTLYTVLTPCTPYFSTVNSTITYVLVIGLLHNQIIRECSFVSFPQLL